VYQFDAFLFLQAQHLPLQKSENVWIIYAVEKQKIMLLMSVFIEEQRAFSPLRMPFGGIMASEDASYQQIEQFTDFVLAFCQEKNVQDLQITSYPFSYAPSVSAICTHIFLQKGFRIIKSELTHFLFLEKDFQTHLHHSARRRLKKCKNNGFVFEYWQTPDLAFVYDFVAANRQRKNYPISMNYEAFEQTLQSFPNNYWVFVLKKDAEIAALTVAVVVNNEILYNFYPADSEKYLVFSPMIMLLEGLYQFAQRQGFRILDLGISSDKSVPNYGLIRFKENMGCQSALKLSFEKNFKL
jgi:hypothetical protein